MPAAPQTSTATAGRTFWKVWEKFLYLIAAVLFALIYWTSEADRALAAVRAGCALFGFIGVATLAYAWRLSVHARASTEWLPVEARILDSEVVSERGGTPYFFPRVTYQYEVQGLTYHSSNVVLVKVEYALAEARAIVGKYPAGARVLAYVDPADPRTAVLEPGVGNTRQYATSAVVGGIFTVFGAAAWFLIPLLARSR